MNRKYSTVITLAVAALAAGNALAADPAAAKTRAQVQAELQEAQRTGDIVEGETSQKLNQLYPNRYPAKAVAQGKTRAEVNAELAEAQHTGDIVDGGTGQKLNELYANRYPAKVAAPMMPPISRPSVAPATSSMPVPARNSTSSTPTATPSKANLTQG